MKQLIGKKEGEKSAGRFKRRMISGVLVLCPLVITLFILKIIFSALTAFVLPVLEGLPVLRELPDVVLLILSTFVALLMIYLVGMFTTHLIGLRLIQMGERLMMKLPIVRSVYSASKQVMDTFSNSTKAAFSATVLVSFPHPGARAIGFVTGTILDPDGRTLYRIFVATTPNPTSGFLLLLPKEEVAFTDISVEDGIKMIVSGGMLAPENYAVQNPPV
ncbi:MAG: DUF502 domain-containing protein [Pontiellaceae bacterium]|jgi:uncharacterized membrane protein|nr:DUF502 domain-containing protein [Pontiellaceae bacterium]